MSAVIVSKQNSFELDVFHSDDIAKDIQDLSLMADHYRQQESKASLYQTEHPTNITREINEAHCHTLAECFFAAICTIMYSWWWQCTFRSGVMDSAIYTSAVQNFDDRKYCKLAIPYSYLIIDIPTVRWNC